ncbi:MAG: hypothetical protein ACRCZI_01810 [Cetobacterium sp.]
MAKVAELSGLAKQTVRALHAKFGAGISHLETIRKNYRDLAMLMGADLLWGVDPAKLEKLPEDKKIHLAMELLERYAEPERPQPKAEYNLYNLYNLTPSHANSAKTLPGPKLEISNTTYEKGSTTPPVLVSG